jgi:N-methylhydantoinase B/oxoprolinase/acetone carboxylase alpha subunit
MFLTDVKVTVILGRRVLKAEPTGSLRGKKALRKGKFTKKLSTGNCIRIETPGGRGYGNPGGDSRQRPKD